MYIETSSPRTQGQKARLLSQSVAPTTSACVSFYYHMYGRNIGSLNVYLKQQNGALGAPAWTRKGNQQNKWTVGQFSVFAGQNFQVCL